jgi:chemotaxis protein CheD
VLDGHRYVDYSIRYLAEQFDAIGAKRREIEVKVFGGADVLLIACAGMRRPSIGALNCEVALEVLCSEGFDVLASDLRGTDGRSIRFHTGTGEVLLRRLTTCKE